jgi:preprotein translocase subunit YajC
MNKHSVELVAFAPAPTQPGQEPPPFWVNMVPLVLLMVMLYVIMIRPQQKKAREHTNLLTKLKVGDKIVTTGGIIGTVLSLKDKNVAIRSADTKMDILKSAIAEVTEKNPS